MAATEMDGGMDDQQLLRYSRQIMLPRVDVAGQQRLLESHVLLIGLGGLGSPVAIYLAAVGVGRLTLVDHDVVDLTNLQRQILYQTADLGRSKSESAQEHLHALNPEIEVTAIDHKLDGDELEATVAAVDLVIDGSDNFATRFQINQACVVMRRPLLSGAAIRMEGQVTLFRNDLDDSPCYRCLYRDDDEESLSCSESGILAPVVGVIGAIQAVEALKFLIGVGESLSGRLLLWDAWLAEWRSVLLRKDPNCPICSLNRAST